MVAMCETCADQMQATKIGVQIMCKSCANHVQTLAKWTEKQEETTVKAFVINVLALYPGI
jgi:uncharacterized Zn ribbon protein